MFISSLFQYVTAASIIDAIRDIMFGSIVMKTEKFTPAFWFGDLNCHLSSALLKITSVPPHLSGLKCNFPALNPEVLPGDTLGRLRG